MVEAGSSVAISHSTRFCIALIAIALTFVAHSGEAVARQSGRILIYANEGGKGFRWYSIRPDGSDRRLHSRIGGEFGPRRRIPRRLHLAGDLWSADGRWLVYQDGPPGRFKVISRDAKTRRTIGTYDTFRLVDRGGPTDPPNFSPDGRHIVMHRVWSDSFSNYGEVAIARTDGSGERTIYEPSTESPWGLWRGTWLDNTHVAVIGPPAFVKPMWPFLSAYPAGCGTASWSIDINDGGISRILRETGAIREQDFSADGRRMAYIRYDMRENGVDSCVERGPNELWVANTDGSGAHRVAGPQPRGRTLEYPSWSPDGRRIAFQASSGNLQDLYTVRPNGTGLRRIHRRTGWFPQWIRGR